MTEIKDDLKKFSDVLTNEECKTLILYIKDKIEVLNKDSAVLIGEHKVYVEAMRRFVNKDMAIELIKKVGERVKTQIVNQNSLLIDIMFTDKKLNLGNIDVKLVKKINSGIKSLRKNLKEAKIKFNFSIDENSEVVTEGDCKGLIINTLLRDLDYCISSESADKRYYKALINKIESDADFRRSDGEELWCMCENRKESPEIVVKIKDYIKTLSEEGADD